MKTITITSLAAGLCSAVLLLTSFIQLHPETKTDKPSKATAEGFAVVELFTSEGCSSCPPADALIAKAQKDNEGKAVYILAFHVDYWDFQGWKDVFSQNDFTQRQYQYASWLRTASVYTPQIVVNGQKEFIGSQEQNLSDAISKGLHAQPVAALNLQAVQNQNKISLKYQTKDADKNTILQLALVQKLAQTTVKRGENAGRQLSHAQIVRQLQSQTIHASGAGEAQIILPKGYALNDFEVIGFLQNKNNGKILAAAKPDLKEIL